MKANELRIGNLVSESYSDSTFKIVNINSEKLDYVDMHNINFTVLGRYDIDSIKPIPLTEEWLLKFGFEKINNRYVLNNFRFHIEKPCNYDNFVFCDGYRVLTEKIKYLHQLQNLYFALTNEELIYNHS